MTYNQIVNFNTAADVTMRWPDFKSITSSKGLSMQWAETTEAYQVFAVDDTVSYHCLLWKTSHSSEFPFDTISPDYLQAQNDIDVTDFEDNWKNSTNSRISNRGSQTIVLFNSTVTAGGNQIFSGIGVRQVNLFINCTQAFTGVSPGIQFTIQEVDPGDQSTVIGSSITGAAIFSPPQTQELTLNLTTSSTIKVSWIIVGSSSPTFPGTYATLVTKPTTTISGVDINGVERILKPDTSGRLLVSGSNAISTPVTVDPVIIGGVNPGGVAGYSQLNSDNSLIVTQGINKQPIFINGTITSGSISNLSGLGVAMVNLFINIKNAPTGINPGIIFSMYEIDPGDQATPIGTSVTGATLTGIGTQMLSLPLTSSGLVQVSWAVIGTSPSFTGTYVTAIMKDSSVVSGPVEIGSPMEGNPIINGAVDQAGNVQAISAKLVNGMYNMVVCDDKAVNKLDQIILLLTDIRDRGE